MDVSAEDIFDRLSEAGVKISEDPELAELHIDASRHFAAATQKLYEGERDVAVYELEATEMALDRFDSVREIKSNYL